MSQDTEQDMKDSMMAALENVIDPELGIDIVNLGLVYDVQLADEDIAKVTMTLTSIGCPMGPQIVDQVKTALGELPEVKDTDVNIVFNPPWSKDNMSRYAKIALGVR
ncbi:Metal-sulfur cluster biosynthetic enzyme [Paenisporosarcina quisquiliarum]|jgi:metal-sulfur cluster biosynthetic enzyme|uniref:Metal-sulfur cluster assembly factor n=1 Tax=Psychrobacillus psychrodurans TaxID=126157 RepID=A0A9X3L5K9_9BACI|nr:metal-sulfur cluster assembly factor [Psychrobacillus psychrodurans]SEM30207.1 Metal-sulfur cluster biosynthetic enzyme [Paenisporosarcina quisquiliarum]MCK1996424.1 metal-sulfur cluster assembly factor [Psychrobacillus psychrodurans]MCZ8531740.1 metal-sulfur cluster assembly factor [Psychrobacillus psychrodurans]MCZ8539276.1 metal-sulfur cluster assembly factor [Psychrobacillus psychrodurans]SFM35426.1 Metal-sulfur cluster biosynthetic enzyme [Psychrobacillus psychrodurans]